MNTATITTDTAKFIAKEIRIENYYLRFGNNGGKEKNLPTLQYGRYKTVGKNKGMRSQIWGYYYKSEEERNKKALETYTNLKANLDLDKEQKAANKKMNADFDLQTLIGKVFYSSWGYDQTNVDFFQVIGVTSKMVIIREISGNSVEGSDGMMCDRVRPNVNDFISKETKHLVKVNKYGVYISNGRYPLSEYLDGEKGTHRSWYA